METAFVHQITDGWQSKYYLSFLLWYRNPPGLLDLVYKYRILSHSDAR